MHMWGKSGPKSGGHVLKPWCPGNDAIRIVILKGQTDSDSIRSPYGGLGTFI